MTVVYAAIAIFDILCIIWGIQSLVGAEWWLVSYDPGGPNLLFAIGIGLIAPPIVSGVVGSMAAAALGSREP